MLLDSLFIDIATLLIDVVLDCAELQLLIVNDQEIITIGYKLRVLGLVASSVGIVVRIIISLLSRHLDL